MRKIAMAVISLALVGAAYAQWDPMPSGSYRVKVSRDISRHMFAFMNGETKSVKVASNGAGERLQKTYAGEGFSVVCVEEKSSYPAECVMTFKGDKGATADFFFHIMSGDENP